MELSSSSDAFDVRQKMTTKLRGYEVRLVKRLSEVFFGLEVAP